MISGLKAQLTKGHTVAHTPTTNFCLSIDQCNGDGCLPNRQEGMLIQVKPDAPTQHAQFILVSYYRLSARLGKPVKQQRMLGQLGIEMWINL